MPTIRGISMPLLRHQLDFSNSKALIRGLVAGRGAGKSWSASYDILKRAKRDRLYMAISPTFKMLNESTWRTFESVANRLGRLLSVSKPSGTILTRIRTFEPDRIPSSGIAEIIFNSAHNPDSLRGPNLSGAWFDEMSIMQKQAYDIVLPTLREGGEAGYLDCTFTPRGRGHWTYDVFYNKDGTPRRHTEVFRARQRDNFMLSALYLEIMRDEFPEGSRLARQELEGEFVDYDGMLFRREWFKEVMAVPHDGMRVRYWDKAAKERTDETRESSGGCYTVGTLVCRSKGKFYIEDVVRGQWSPHKRNEIIKATAEADAAAYNRTVVTWIEMEPGSGGMESGLISVSDLAGHMVYLDKVRVSKSERALSSAAQAEVGNVCIKTANWTQAFLDEIQSFPEGKYKDQVDSFVGALNKLALSSGVPGQVDQMISYPSTADLVDPMGFAISSAVDSKETFSQTPWRSQETADLLTYLSSSHRT